MTDMTSDIKPVSIQNKCPSCGWKSLFIGSGGWITCGNIDEKDGCKYPDLDEAVAAAETAARLDELKKLIDNKITFEWLDTPDGYNENPSTYLSYHLAKDRISQLERGE